MTFLDVNALFVGVLLGSLLLWLLSDILNIPFLDTAKRENIAKRFKNKHVWITGASDGLGAAMALTLAENCPDVRITLTARSLPNLEMVEEKILALSSQAQIVPIDIQDWQAVNRGIRLVECSLFGHVDVLIANAGINHSGRPFAQLDGDVICKVVQTNLLGAIYCVQAVIGGMIKRNAGQIVAISSQAANRGVPGASVYGASKAGLSNFIESVRVELVTQAPGITVTAVHPGFIDTSAIRHTVHPKPLMLSTTRAALITLNAIANQDAYIGYPRLMEHVVLGIARLLPSALYAWIVGNAAPAH